MQWSDMNKMKTSFTSKMMSDLTRRRNSQREQIAKNKDIYGWCNMSRMTKQRDLSHRKLAGSTTERGRLDWQRSLKQFMRECN